MPLALGPRVLDNSIRMTFELVRYDAARKAIAAAHRVDEVKHIRDKAEAVRVYAKQAGDFELQNKAAEIRILAERRAGELLADMAKNPGTRGTGRPRKDGTKIRRSSSATTYPPKLDDIGITKDQSSKWQRLAKLIDDATFERALIRAKERNGELTAAALLREIKEIMQPVGGVVEPDINVVAAELIRDVESDNRREKLKTVVQSRNRLNPTIRKNLILALKNAARDTVDVEAQLSKDFHEFPTNGKCHQRVIREHMAKQPEPQLKEKRALAADFKNALVRAISYDEAKNLILANEWLGNMGTTEFTFGLFFGAYLGGAICFGSTAGTNTKNSVCGAEHADKVLTLSRGACVHWAHPHSASFLINAACREMTKKGYHIFVAYSDPAANEIGTVYQASNWLYCGTTNPTEKYRTPEGKIWDARNVQHLTREWEGGEVIYARTRAYQKQLLLEEGCEFFKDGGRKFRYVGIYGDRRLKRILRNALRWSVLPYPKRKQVCDTTSEVTVAPSPELAGFDDASVTLPTV
jgi:hypothetical protein